MIHWHSSQKNKIQIISILKTVGPTIITMKMIFFKKIYMNSAEKRGTRLVDRIFTMCNQKTPSALIKVWKNRIQ